MERHVEPPLKKPKLLIERTRHCWNPRPPVQTASVANIQNSQNQNSYHFPAAFHSAVDFAQPGGAFVYQPYHAPFSASPVPHTSPSAHLSSHIHRFSSPQPVLQPDAYGSFSQANDVSLTYPEGFTSTQRSTVPVFATQTTSLALLQPKCHAMAAPQHPGESSPVVIDLTGSSEQHPPASDIADSSCNHQSSINQGNSHPPPEDTDFRMAFELQAQFVQASGLDSEGYLNALFLSEDYEPDTAGHMALGQGQSVDRGSAHAKVQNNTEPSAFDVHGLVQLENPFSCNEYSPKSLQIDLSAAVNDLDLFTQRQATKTCQNCVSNLQRSQEATVKDLIRSWIDKAVPSSPVFTCLTCFARVCGGCGSTEIPGPLLPGNDAGEVMWCWHDSRLLALQLLLDNLDPAAGNCGDENGKQPSRRSSEPNWKKALSMPSASKRRLKNFCQVGHLLKSSSPQAAPTATDQAPYPPVTYPTLQHSAASQFDSAEKVPNATIAFGDSEASGWSWLEPAMNYGSISAPQYAAGYAAPIPSWHNAPQDGYPKLPSYSRATPQNQAATVSSQMGFSTSNQNPLPCQQMAPLICSPSKTFHANSVARSSSASASTTLPVIGASYNPYHGVVQPSITYPQQPKPYMQSGANVTDSNLYCNYVPPPSNAPTFKPPHGMHSGLPNFPGLTSPNFMPISHSNGNTKPTASTNYPSNPVQACLPYVPEVYPSPSLLGENDSTDSMHYWEDDSMYTPSSSPCSPSRSKLPKGTGYGEATTRHAAMRNRSSHSRCFQSETVKKERTNRDHFTTAMIRLLGDVLPSFERESTFDLDPPLGLIALLLRCPLMEEMAELLRNDSIADATRRKDLYLNLFQLVGTMAKHPLIVHAVLSSRPGGTWTELCSDESSAKPSIAACMTNLVRQTRLILKRTQTDSKAFHVDEEGDMLGLCIAVNDVAELLQPHFHTSAEPSAVERVSKSTDNQRWLEWHRENCVLEVPDAQVLETHYFCSSAKSLKQGAKGRMKRLVEESANLTTSLPEGIFMKYAESRPDVMKVLIIGPEGTPYENGAFEFDVWCPSNYPQEPPQFHFRTTARGKGRFNPNLYEDGKVCLSLLNTWTGERWKPGESTLLQVLVSLQAMVFCEQPYYNEPGFENHVSHAEAERYNNRVRGLTVRLAMLDWLRGSKTTVWTSILETHFARHKEHIKDRLKQWKAGGKQTFTEAEAAELTQALEGLGSGKKGPRA